MRISPARRAAAAAIEEAIRSYHAALCEEDGDDEPAMLGQFVVLSAWTMLDDADGGSRHRYMRVLSDDEMPLSHLVGLLQVSLDTVREDYK